MRTQHFETLDAMRGVAAIAVVCLHSSDLLGPLQMPHAYLAVDFFFALSGLVLTRAYSDRFDAGMTVLQFFRIRALRLFPLYLLGTAIGLAAVLWPILRGYAPWPDTLALVWTVAASLMMLPGSPLVAGPPFIMPLNPPAWSLVFEMAANLLLVTLWPLLKMRTILPVLVLSSVILVAQTVLHGNLDGGSLWTTVALGVDRTLFSFSLGVCLGRLPLSSGRPRTHIAIVPLGLIGISLALRPPIGPFFDLICVLLVFPALLYWGASVEPKGGETFRFLGKISFALYAIHFPLLMIFGSVLFHLPKHWQEATPWVGLIVVASFVALAWLADSLDRRVRERFRAWLGERRTSAL